MEDLGTLIEVLDLVTLVGVMEHGCFLDLPTLVAVAEHECLLDLVIIGWVKKGKDYYSYYCSILKLQHIGFEASSIDRSLMA